MSKPEYRVPSMREIRAQPRNGFKVVSTFSGGGGSCTGYYMAGYSVVYANEFIEAARETYKANHPTTILDGRDIRSVSAESILEMTGLAKGEIDLFDGSPPCSAFSTAGKREKGWGKAKEYSDDAVQVVDDLFFEYARLLRGLQPKTFVAENVSGLIKGTAKGYFKLILKELRACGYNVKASLLDASWLGVPQARERVIFVGVREDLNIEPVFPKPLAHQYTTRDACPSIAIVKCGGAPNRWLNASRPHPTIVARGYDIGLHAYFSGGTYVSESTADNPRRLTIDEVKALCGFPPDYELTGDFRQQWERLGRSVPPVMMMHVAKTIQTEILERIRHAST